MEKKLKILTESTIETSIELPEIQLTESLDGGYKYKSVLIRAGVTSSANATAVINGVRVPIFKNYPADVLKKAVDEKLFEGTVALLRNVNQHLTADNTGVNQVAGTFTEVIWNEAAQQVEGIFNVKRGGGYAKHARQFLAELWNKTKSIGLSIAAFGSYIVNKVEDKFIATVTEITEIQSIDPVDVGNAGGKLIALVESQIKGGIMNPKIRAMLWALFLASGLVKESDVLSNFNDDQLKGLKDKLPADDIKRADAILAGQTDEPPKDTPPKDTPPKDEPPKDTPPADDPNKQKDVVDEVKKILDQAKELVSTEKAEKAISEAKLPAAVKDKLRTQFKGRIKDEKDVENVKEVLKQEQKVLAEMKIPGFDNLDAEGNIRVGNEKKDKIGLALEYLLIPERFRSTLSESERKAFADVAGTYSIKELYTSLTGDFKVTGNVPRSGILTEGLVTSDWATTLGNAIGRVMLMEYQSNPYNQDWRRFASVGSVPDFKAKTYLRIGGYADLPAVAEDGDFADVASSPDEEAVTSTASKRGYKDKVTREMIINDDVGAVQRIGLKMGKAAARTLYKFVFNLFATNPTMPYDSVALFHATHNNLMTSALGSDGVALGTARRKMLDQVEQNSAEKLGIRPRFLIIPPFEAIEKIARDLTTVAYGVNNQVPQFYQTWQIEPIVAAHFTDENDWYLIADPADVESVAVDFLQGQTEPQMFAQDTPASDSFFVNERIRYKIRHEYGGAPLDHRAFVKSAVA